MTGAEASYPGRWSVAAFHDLLGPAGADEKPALELLDGEVRTRAVGDVRHDQAVAHVKSVIGRRAGRFGIIRSERPLRLDDWSEPTPDIALVDPGSDRAGRTPRADDVLLVVEIAVGSLDFDLAVRLPLYARAGIPEVWVLAPEMGAVYLYREPVNGTFGFSARLRLGDRFRIELVPGAGMITTAELMPP